ncbi:hypothetical protein ADL12_37830 [Streptomyces regalis]|uniref:Novel STAND NTPase 1 domain-containing protein n=1 Tax=Streptomyces regalis TaxID=68262 RepID=A0A101JCF2_9ACTN|nr:WD40 repeat domain-containing protein [Streptomyces regalis]KUL24216.1 hypothetical protein ADL12_37830 [Streptomyces regalis]
MAELAERLERQRFVVLIGASGSGKSSLLRAGLVPRLQSAMTTVVVTPGPKPLEECAVRLAALAGVTPGGLYKELKDDPGNLGRVARQITARPHADDGDMLLVVDQFEETFTLCRDMVEQDRFVEALVAAASAEGSRCRVALGVHADFYAHCTHHPLLVEAMRDAQVPVGPMNLDELRRVVVKPAQQAGLTVESALLATLMAQAHRQVGVLPLLSHALLQTWRRRRGSLLTLDALDAAGGIEGALAKSAEEFYEDLDADQRTTARHLFMRLTAPAAGTEDTKRRVTRGELDEDHITTSVVEQAAAARLVSLDRDRIEIAHEALIGSWPRLRDWLAADRDRRRVHHQLTEAAETWVSLGEDPGALYRGTRLEAARQLTESDDIGLSTREHAFLLGSLAAAAAESRLAVRGSRRLRVLITTLGVLALLTTATTVLAVRANRAMTVQRNDAIALNVAAEATRMYPAAPALATQLALVSYRLKPDRNTLNALLSTLMTTWTAHRSEAYALDVSHDSTLLATGGRDRTVRLWDIRDPRQPVRVGTVEGSQGAVYAVAMHPGKRILATGGVDEVVRLWDVTRPDRPRSVSLLPHHGDTVRAMAFSPDGRTLADAGQSGRAHVWDITDPRRPKLRAVLPGHTDTVRSVAFSADGRLLATGGQDASVRLWDLGAPGRPTLRAAWHAQELGVFWVEFSPRAGLLATAGGGVEAVRLWDTTEPGRPRLVAGICGHDDVVGGVDFSRDGRTLVSSSDDRSVRIWDVSTPTAPRNRALLTAYDTAVMGVRFSPDGRTLVSGVFDGTVRLLTTDFDQAVSRACDAPRRPISRDSWQRYFAGVPYRPPCA